jgi:NAD(P)-dependent dehydrogenase (short-subunit alcohol dehydrogenase family)
MKKLLTGKVALVAGATRGAGRGIALQLGAAGATVYVTGRTTRSQRSDEYNAANYRVSFFYDLAKASVNRMAFALAIGADCARCRIPSSASVTFRHDLDSVRSRYQNEPTGHAATRRLPA